MAEAIALPDAGEPRDAGRLARLTPASLLRGFLQTVFRMVPWPIDPGLYRSGAADQWSPVIVTGNYELTVRRVVRALRGVDAWIVVAPSSGINVWCAASGGHLGTHQVVTALKTSDVAAHVRHRRAILPQLAATGVQARAVQRRCGWRTRFGPVYAEDLPRYLAAGHAKDDSMRHVRFGMRERIEMALAWGGPSALLLAAVLSIAHPSWMLGSVLLALSLATAAFFVCDRLPAPRPLWFAAVAATIALAPAVIVGAGTSATIATVCAALALSAVLTFDYAGSTPIEGGALFDEHAWRVELDRDRCRGVYTCWEVCPEACFVKPDAGAADRRILVPHADRCVRCGACIVQCPMDALYFVDDAGGRVTPETIRRFKLNLLGKRTVTVGTEADVDLEPASHTDRLA